MITGERGQRAVVIMVREVDRRETADTVKRFCLELRGCCGESSSTQRGRTRPLNRILEAVKIRRESKRALSEQNEKGLFLERVGKLYKISRGDTRAKARCCDLAAWCRRESVKGRRERRPERGVGMTPKTASNAAVFCRLPTDRQFLLAKEFAGS
jgi:hypothetical protein